MRKSREPGKNRVNRMINLLGAVLLLAGFGLLGYAGYQKASFLYHQHRLKEAYRETIFDLSESSIPYRRVVITEELPMRLLIPKLDVDVFVVYGLKSEYNPVTNEYEWNMEVLDQAPAHFQMTPLPSTNPGNVAIAGHRGSRWGFFTDLDLLEEGDEIYLDVGGYRFIYHVLWIKIVEPDDMGVIIDPVDYPALTLQTCEPKNRPGTHRLIVRARLETVEKAPAP